MKRSILAFSLLILVVVGCNDSNRRSNTSAPATADNSTVERDNTQVNVRDRSEEAKTPINQNENQRDVNLTADIRKRVVDTKMSINAQNVKIITQEGKVTLRGPVASLEEKNQIESIAGEVAGPSNVVSQLEVQQ